MAFYAHTDSSRPRVEGDESRDQWQKLEDHLQQTGEIAGRHAVCFHSEAWGRLAGLWHDLGKFHEKFQERLRGADVAIEHAGVGALWAFKRDASRGLPLAFAIVGHHTGLPNLTTAGEGPRLEERLERNEVLLAECHGNIPSELLQVELPDLPAELCPKPADEEDTHRLWRRREMWIRFLFSCLVDADRSDTAAFCDPQRFQGSALPSSMANLRSRCEHYIRTVMEQLSPEERQSPVNCVRAEVLEQCRRAAKYPPGVFTLTVPTGGGKTLSSMMFALRHAEYHGLCRVFVVIPYTSIIEQNAAVYRQCLGMENVLEHHCNLSLERVGEYEDSLPHKLAAENWDMPVIVTTTVQFFETLFASRPSAVRKLHNVARSVIILDEIQTLPPGLLNPILDGLTTLAEQYGCSIVLSTATPPALVYRDRFPYGLKNVRPIIESPKILAERLQRVTIEWPDRQATAWSIPELVDRLTVHPRVLCVVHRRRDARQAARSLAERTDGPVFHLSALMCPAHRLETIERIRRALQGSGPCRVVSTQLVEAGVDLDFPVVYRALGGLDSIVQAAGRCNREGRLPQGGRVVLFRAASSPAPGVPRRALEVTESLLSELDYRVDTADPDCFEKYFRSLYFAGTLDKHDIQRFRRQFDFASVGRRFKIIEDEFTSTVIVPWGDAGRYLQELRQATENGRPVRNLLRRLQSYTVSLYARSCDQLRASGALEEVLNGIYALGAPYRHLYSEVYGLADGDEPIQADPEALIS